MQRVQGKVQVWGWGSSTEEAGTDVAVVNALGSVPQTLAVRFPPYPLANHSSQFKVYVEVLYTVYSIIL